MSNIPKKIELLANIGIVVIAILLGVVSVKKYIIPIGVDEGNNNRGVAREADIIGKKISLPDMDWTKSSRNLVLFIQSACHFCTDSAPFYKQLVNKQHNQSNLQIVAASSEPIQTSKAYLDSLGVSINEVRQVDLRSIGVAGTPTLLQVDNSGVITDVWLGQLDSKREAEVLARLQ